MKTRKRKRTKRIRLFLLGSLTAGAIAGCSPSRPTGISSDNVYPNNYYVPGAGYYHAPFNSWFAHPYNFFDAQKRLYFYGGQWGPLPYASIVNLSSPSPQTVKNVEAMRTDIQRGGFGCTGGYGGYYHGGGYYHSHS